LNRGLVSPGWNGAVCAASERWNARIDNLQGKQHPVIRVDHGKGFWESDPDTPDPDCSK
jgi:hypothetical protein